MAARSLSCSGSPLWARVTKRVSRWANASRATQVCCASISTMSEGFPRRSKNSAASCSVRSSCSTSRRESTSNTRLMRDSPGARLAATNANLPKPRAGIRWWGHINNTGISVATTGMRSETGNPSPKAAAGSVSYPHVSASMNASAVLRGDVASAGSCGSKPSASSSARTAASAAAGSGGRLRAVTEPGYDVISFTLPRQRLRTVRVKRAPKLTLPASVPRFASVTTRATEV